ncbi:hypothetical protein K435DRAFT_798467 [Dendrothele bispora CBS 962.96]|uniref:Uncharacterized protein n=1 Tax=Dendrothele bispora (strain CBS 962.96) TaxID=1314807 RepID=A0A4S8LZP3_DENBC|nr:hypothetical protein K435DRAFT_798467 [Dendrothele bispora CBS 962.96]
MNQMDVPFTRIFTMMRMERRLEGYNTLETTTHYNWQNVDVKPCIPFVITIATTSTGHTASNPSSSAPDILLVCVICYSEPSLVFFINDIIHGVELSTTEVGNRFFAVSTSLTGDCKFQERVKAKGRREERQRETKGAIRTQVFIRYSDELGQVQESIFECYRVGVNSHGRFYLIAGQRQGREKLDATGSHWKELDILDKIPYRNYVSNFDFAYRYIRYESIRRLSKTRSLENQPMRTRLSMHDTRSADNLESSTSLYDFRPSPLPSESASVFYSGTSHLFDFVNDYGSVHADEGLIGAWREEKTGQEGRYFQATSSGSSDKNKKKVPAGYPKRGIDLSDPSMTIMNGYGTVGWAR